MITPKRKRPSILRILNTDFFAGVGLAAPVFLWIGYIMLGIFQKLPWLGWMCVASIPIGIGVAVYRCWTIISIFERGEEVDAVLSGTWFRKERGWVEFDYTFQGEVYHSGCSIMKTEQSIRLEKGQTVTLVFDPRKPQRVFVRDLFVK